MEILHRASSPENIFLFLSKESLVAPVGGYQLSRNEALPSSSLELDSHVERFGIAFKKRVNQRKISFAVKRNS
ncbi:hypothetical protein ACS0TY_010785 [Phlomoides rotata]